MKKLITASMTAAALAVSAVPAIAAGDYGTTPKATSDAPKGTTESRSTSEFVDDATLTAKVKSALAQDDLTKARNINVDTSKGVVSLRGQVDSRAEMEQASKVADSIDGVVSVKNQLTTKTK